MSNRGDKYHRAITEQDCIDAKLKLITWNGLIHEYYLPILHDGLGINGSRIGVMFPGYYDAIEFWLTLPQTKVRLYGARTIEDMKQLLRLIKRDAPE